ncbi:MAG: flavodoxin family protein, partial [Candidatus Atribacteria bacterium]
KGIAVAVHAQKGASRTIQTLEGFLSSHEFSSLGSVTAKGYQKGDVLSDKEAVERAQKIGDKIIRLVKRNRD